jgi:hypothetical protein
MTRIVLHIDKIVLHGVDPAQRTAFSRAMRAELTRQLASADSARSLAVRPDSERLVVQPLRQPAARPAQLGRDVAQGIARGLNT